MKTDIIDVGKETDTMEVGTIKTNTKRTTLITSNTFATGNIKLLELPEFITK